MSEEPASKLIKLNILQSKYRDASKIFKCGSCPATYPSKATLNIHLRRNNHSLSDSPQDSSPTQSPTQSPMTSSTGKRKRKLPAHLRNYDLDHHSDKQDEDSDSEADTRDEEDALDAFLRDEDDSKDPDFKQVVVISSDEESDDDVQLIPTKTPPVKTPTSLYMKEDDDPVSIRQVKVKNVIFACKAPKCSMFCTTPEALTQHVQKVHMKNCNSGGKKSVMVHKIKIPKGLVLTPAVAPNKQTNKTEVDLLSPKVTKTYPPSKKPSSNVQKIIRIGPQPVIVRSRPTTTTKTTTSNDEAATSSFTSLPRPSLLPPDQLFKSPVKTFESPVKTFESPVKQNVQPKTGDEIMAQAFASIGNLEFDSPVKEMGIKETETTITTSGEENELPNLNNLNGEDSNLINCESCAQKFFDKYSLNEHIQNVHLEF